MPGVEKTVERSGLVMSTEAFGDPSDPPVLLIMGATSSMLGWPDAFCERLAGEGRYVIRYDNRDTGRSTTGEPGTTPYTMEDMASDTVLILDDYGFDSAHVVGMSLGGMIAQLVALHQPDRVRTLTLISSSAFDEDDSDLPPMDPAFMAHFSKIDSLDWSDRAAVVAFQTESYRIAAGEGAAFDAAAYRALTGREFDRAINIRSALNHGGLTGGEASVGRVGEIAIPTLVIHGRHDPILSIQHGRRLASKLPDARMVEFEGGHELNARDWPMMIAEIVRHTA